MAKILVSLFQPIVDCKVNNLYCFYESLITELQRMGNQVLVNNNYLTKNLKSSTTYQNFLNQLTEFSPELIITFNNQITENILQATVCPILLFDADGPEFFACPELVRKYIERYYMISSWDGWNTEAYSNLGFLKNRIHSIHLATSIQKEDKEKLHNISFIGTKFGHLYTDPIAPHFKKNDNNLNIYNALQEFWQSQSYNYDEILKKHCPNNKFSLFQTYSIFDSRPYILSSLLDLGLKLYGHGWNSLDFSSPALISAFDNTPIFSLKHNQDLYNSSKINISISHPQTNGKAFPWRVYDIMASNGVLVTSSSTLLEKLTKGHVNIPTFHSPYEARDLCKKLLLEDNMRADIIAASNEYIEKFGRWDDNIKKLEEISGIKLYNLNKNPALYDDKINVIGDNLTSQKDQKEKTLSKPVMKHKNRIKLFIYFGALTLAQVPIFRAFFKNNTRQKLYKKVQKYWR